MITHHPLPSHTRDTTRSSLRWRYAPNASPLRDLLESLSLDDWLKSGQAHIVKQGPHRIVYRLDIDGGTYFLKRHLIPDRLTWWRQWIRPTKAFLEYERALRVAERGIATVEPLAWASSPGGESYLLTRGLEDVVPLHQWVTQHLPRLCRAEQTHARQRLARALGRFLARIHGAGVTHQDFHAGNLMLRDHGDRLELFLLDLDAAHLGPPLRQRARWANLAMFQLWFLARASRTDQMRFLRAYVAEWSDADPVPEARRLADRLHATAWDYARTFWRKRDERCTKSNRYYQRICRGPVEGHALKELDPQTLLPFLTDPDAPFAWPGVTILKDSPSSKVIALDLVINGKRRSFVYKRFTCKSVWKSLGWRMRPSPALLSWIHGHGFYERGLPSARPWLLLQRRPGRLVGDGYLLAEKIEHASDLHEYLRRLQPLPATESRSRLRSSLCTLGRVLRMMHERHYSHRDLKAANILLADPTAPVVGEADERGLLPPVPRGIWIIDLDGVSLGRPSVSQRLRNLARLSASFHDDRTLTRTDRLRFLRAYFAARPNEWVNWKRWWRILSRATSEKVERNRRIGRGLW